MSEVNRSTLHIEIKQVFVAKSHELVDLFNLIPQHEIK